MVILNRVIGEQRAPPSFLACQAVLLPKACGDLLSPLAWCPIALLNYDRKLITTIVAERLGEVADQIMKHCQTTCAVPGRSCHTNFLVSLDIIAYASSKSVAAMSYTLDLAKSIDRVHHCYLFSSLPLASQKYL